MTTSSSACRPRIWAVWGLEPSQPLTPDATVKVHGQVVVFWVHKISPQHPPRDRAWLSLGIPRCYSSTNDICKLFSKCLWTTKAQEENHAFHQPGKQILGFLLVLLATESRAVSNATVPASAAERSRGGSSLLLIC